MNEIGDASDDLARTLQLATRITAPELPETPSGLIATPCCGPDRDGMNLGASRMVLRHHTASPRNAAPNGSPTRTSDVVSALDLARPDRRDHLWIVDHLGSQATLGTPGADWESNREPTD